MKVRSRWACQRPIRPLLGIRSLNTPGARIEGMPGKRIPQHKLIGRYAEAEQRAPHDRCRRLRESMRNFLGLLGRRGLIVEKNFHEWRRYSPSQNALRCHRNACEVASSIA